MDKQVTVFLYSIGANSSFTLSLSVRLTQERRKPMFYQQISRRSSAFDCRYHFYVLKHEETLFLMMKRSG
jgi:hypothetical protein